MVLAVQSESKIESTTGWRVQNMRTCTLVICRDETDPRRVRISGTNADHLVLFSDTIPLSPNGAVPGGHGPSNGRSFPRWGCIVREIMARAAPATAGLAIAADAQFPVDFFVLGTQSGAATLSRSSIGRASMRKSPERQW